MRYSFHCYGHANVRATHHKTLEFTREEELTRGGTCVIGVRADFAVAPLKEFTGRIRVTLVVGELADTFTAIVNPEFAAEAEMVFRRGVYSSRRTYGVGASKSALHVDREIVWRMRQSETQMLVTVELLLPSPTPALPRRKRPG